MSSSDREESAGESWSAQTATGTMLSEVLVDGRGDNRLPRNFQATTAAKKIEFRANRRELRPSSSLRPSQRVELNPSVLRHTRGPTDHRRRQSFSCECSWFRAKPRARIVSYGSPYEESASASNQYSTIDRVPRSEPAPEEQRHCERAQGLANVQTSHLHHEEPREKPPREPASSPILRRTRGPTDHRRRQSFSLECSCIRAKPRARIVSSGS